MGDAHSIDKHQRPLSSFVTCGWHCWATSEKPQVSAEMVVLEDIAAPFHLHGSRRQTIIGPRQAGLLEDRTRFDPATAIVSLLPNSPWPKSIIQIVWRWLFELYIRVFFVWPIYYTILSEMSVRFRVCIQYRWGRVTGLLTFNTCHVSARSSVQRTEFC